MGGIRDKVRGQNLNNINFMENPSHVDGHLSHESTELPLKSESNSSTCPKLGVMSNQLCQPFQSPMRNLSNCGFSTVEINNGIDRLSKQVAKVTTTNDFDFTFLCLEVSNKTLFLHILGIRNELTFGQSW